MKYSVFYLLVCAVLLSACGISNQSRKAKVLMGLGMTATCNLGDFRKNYEKSENYGVGEWVLDISLYLAEEKADTSLNCFRYYDLGSFGQYLLLLQFHQVDYSLHFMIENPEGRVLTEADYRELFVDVATLLLETRDYPPRRVIFSGEWTSTLEHDRMFDFLTQVRTDFPAFSGEFVYAASPDGLASSFFDWETPELVGILYPEIPYLDYAAYYKKQNKRISRLALEHQKKMLIVHANLSNDAPMPQLYNQLSFWHKKIEIESVNLNTPSCRSSLSSPLPPYGLSGDITFREYIKTLNFSP